MRRKINLPDELPAEEGDANLRAAFALLLPIRRQRLRRSERQQRQHEQQLTQLQSAQRDAEQQLTQRRAAYQTLRDGFDETHLGRQPLTDLQRGLQQEQRAAEALQRQRQALSDCVTQCDAQSEQLAAARAETRLRQRELEKLEMLMQEMPS
ncbi:type III secretion protein [Mixta gaviniae]|uniref:Type III secretion protein n=1 Tax=Mixta gaviniae TaxID=665914 RepID=A0A2L0ICG1_9GAMM|nr:type III secretion protein [Mixta gaviniae]AUX92200.1 type III secretion protein [Mixta gaviniae]